MIQRKSISAFASIPLVVAVAIAATSAVPAASAILGAVRSAPRIEGERTTFRSSIASSARGSCALSASDAMSANNEVCASDALPQSARAAPRATWIECDVGGYWCPWRMRATAPYTNAFVTEPPECGPIALDASSRCNDVVAERADRTSIASPRSAEMRGAPADVRIHSADIRGEYVDLGR